MKFPSSTLGLLQLSAATLAYAQLPFTHGTNKELMGICIPGYDSDVQDRTTPCFRAPDIGYECMIGESPDEIAPIEEQHECMCNSEMWDFFKGCANCFKLHGGKEGIDYNKEEFYDSASVAFCDSEPTPYASFIQEFQEQASITTADSPHSDVLGTQTAVSHYYTQTGTTGNIDSLKSSSTTGTGTQATGGAEVTGTQSGTAGESTETGAASSLQDGSLLAPIAGAMLVMGLLG